MQNQAAPNSTYGNGLKEWQDAKAQAKAHLVDVAKRGGQETYGGLVKRIHAISFDPHGSPLAGLLGQISREEHDACRGMLSVIVVRQEDKMPGDGFYKLAHDLGLGTSDKVALLVSETKKVWNYWKNQKV